MNSCGCEVKAETDSQRRILGVALVLNATMFVVGLTAGIKAESTGLIADSLDMLADASAYMIGLLANRSLRNLQSARTETSVTT
jgi:Co/Zn/Cd efflux system component